MEDFGHVPFPATEKGCNGMGTPRPQALDGGLLGRLLVIVRCD